MWVLRVSGIVPQGVVSESRSRMPVRAFHRQTYKGSLSRSLPRRETSAQASACGLVMELSKNMMDRYGFVVLHDRGVAGQFLLYSSQLLVQALAVVRELTHWHEHTKCVVCLGASTNEHQTYRAEFPVSWNQPRHGHPSSQRKTNSRRR